MSVFKKRNETIMMESYVDEFLSTHTRTFRLPDSNKKPRHKKRERVKPKFVIRRENRALHRRFEAEELDGSDEIKWLH